MSQNPYPVVFSRQQGTHEGIPMAEAKLVRVTPVQTYGVPTQYVHPPANALQYAQPVYIAGGNAVAQPMIPVQPPSRAPVQPSRAPVQPLRISEQASAPEGHAVEPPIVHQNGYSAVAPGPHQQGSQWLADTLDCTDDLQTCIFGTCCAPCMFAEVGMDAYDYGGVSKWSCLSDCLIASILNAKFKPCTLLCCPQYCGPCFKGHILGRFRKKYNLPSLKFGNDCHFKRCESQYCFPDCCQMFWCGPCTLCLMYRQMKLQQHRALTEEPYIPTRDFVFEPALPAAETEML